MEHLGTVGSILTRKGARIRSISPESTVFAAIQEMAEHNIGALLVLEADQLIGVISERDYTRKVALHGRSSRDTLVREIMFHPVISVSQDDGIDECMRIMTENRIRHLPVLERGRPMGVVSIGDCVNWIISTQSAAIQQMESYIRGEY